MSDKQTGTGTAEGTGGVDCAACPEVELLRRRGDAGDPFVDLRIRLVFADESEHILVRRLVGVEQLFRGHGNEHAAMLAGVAGGQTARLAFLLEDGLETVRHDRAVDQPDDHLHELVLRDGAADLEGDLHVAGRQPGREGPMYRRYRLMATPDLEAAQLESRRDPVEERVPDRQVEVGRLIEFDGHGPFGLDRHGQADIRTVPLPGLDDVPDLHQFLLGSLAANALKTIC